METVQHPFVSWSQWELIDEQKTEDSNKESWTSGPLYILQIKQNEN